MPRGSGTSKSAWMHSRKRLNLFVLYKFDPKSLRDSMKNIPISNRLNRLLVCKMFVKCLFCPHLAS